MPVTSSLNKRAGFVFRLHLGKFCIFPGAVSVRLGAMLLVLACLVGVLAPCQLQAQNITLAPVITTVAGNGTTGYTGDGGPATSAELNYSIWWDASIGAYTIGELNYPYVAVDRAGNFYIVDGTNDRVRVVNTQATSITVAGVTIPAGYIATVAGGAACHVSTSLCGDGGPAVGAAFSNPTGVALDGAGNLYIADTNDQRIRVVNAQTTSITVAGVKIAPGNIATVAGTGAKSFGGDGGSATSAYLNQPVDVAVDSTGNIYIADWENSVIRVVNTQATSITVAGVTIAPGNIATMAGTAGAFHYSGDGGLATSATFRQPVCVALDSAGNLYVTDQDGVRVRVINTQAASITVAGVTIAPGNIATVAGTGTAGYSGDGSSATEATLYGAFGVAVDSAGSLYIADAQNNRIRVVNTQATPVTVLGVTIGAGDIATVAGNGTGGFVADGGPAIGAELYLPGGVAIDSTGSLYITDVGNARVRKVTKGPVNFGQVNIGANSTQIVFLSINTALTISSVQTTGFPDYSLVTGSCDPSGTPPTMCEWAVVFTPTKPGQRWGSFVVTDGSGNKYGFGLEGTGVGPALAFTPGIITTVAGGGSGCGTPAQTDILGDGCSATSAELNYPVGVAVDSAGNLYIADYNNNRIRKVDASGVIITVAGSGSGGCTGTNSVGDGCPATSAELNGPSGVAVDSAGNLYIADTDNNRIRKVDASGTITTVAGNGSCAIKDTQGKCYSGDTGQATNAELQVPFGVAVDSAGNLYIADSGNQRIRKVDMSGTITTVAGNGTQGYSGDGVEYGATSAQLDNPGGVTVDSSGNLYIADQSNERVRKVDTSGTITTVAGNGTPGYSGDGVEHGATGAELYLLTGVAVDSAGNLYIADQVNNRIRKVDTSGTITTVAGNGTPGYSGGDGVEYSATNAEIHYPVGVAVDSAGNLYIADSNNNCIRKVDVTTSILSFSPLSVGQTSSTQGIAVSNVGNASLHLTAISPSAGFELQSAAVDPCFSLELLAGGTCQLGAAFAPQASGPATGTLTIADDAFNSPQTVNLSGTGIAAGSGIPMTPVITWTPAPITYGNQLSATQLNATASVAGTSVDGTFAYTPAAGTVLGAGSWMLSVTFTPSDTTQYTTATQAVTINVNPAVLTVTANNQVMNYGGGVPVLTASYSGFVNSDMSAVLSGAPALSTTATSSSPAGSYPVLVAQGTLAAANYSFTFVSGTLIINPGAQTPTLSLLNNYFVTGDHIVRSFDPGAQNNGNMVLGTITIPGSNDPKNEGVPDGADIVAAFLYWQALETNPTIPSSTNALFNGYSITGDQVGSDLPVGCWSSGGSTPIMRAYRANVLPYLPVVGGASQVVGSHAVAVPANQYGTVPGGASLVIVYRVLSQQHPLKATVIYDGNWSMEYPQGYLPYLNQTISGFYDADSSGSAKITDIIGKVTNSGATFSPANAYTRPETFADDDASGITMPNNYAPLQPGQCNVWAAVVFSTTVKNSDGDGLLDAWKAGPAAPDNNAGKPGYYDVRDNSWVDLSGAKLGQKDLFVQLDYMVGTDGHSHQPSPDALNIVQTAFLKHNINVHFVNGNAITEDICSDDTSTSPPNLCMFPGEPGVVAWKTGLEVMKAWPVPPAGQDLTSCIYPASCSSRFQPGRKDSYHYVLFGHSLALPTWSTLANTLVSIEVAGGNATATTSAPINPCPTRITIDGALTNPNMNGVYSVTGCQGASLSLSGVSVSSWTYPNTLPEPQLAIYLSTTDTTSGYSDVGGGDAAVTLGKWQMPQTQTQLVNEQAGTVMHELGHDLSLTHGGRYYPNGSTVPGYEPNCKPNYQSVMSYLFQVDLLQSDSLGHLALDYSGQSLNALDENNNLSTSQGLVGAAYPYTKWYAPSSPVPSTPASSHCDGTPIGPNDKPMYAVAGPASPIAWVNGQDINFDGSLSVLDGYSDWDNIDLRQIGASGNDNLNGVIYSYDGQYQLPIGADLFSGGGGIRASGGGGGIRASGGGGGIRASGGGGGIRASGGGGGIRASGGGGGIRASGGGGGMVEATYQTIDSYARPPRAITEQSGVISWLPPTFGNILGFNVYSNANGSISLITPSPIPYDPSATSYTFTDTSWKQGSNVTYYVTTVDLDPTNSPRESTPAIKGDQATLSVNAPTTLTYDSSETLSTSGGSGTGGVTYNLVSGGFCTLSGATLSANSGTGSCSVTATKAGDSNYNPVTSAPFTVTLRKATASVTPAAASKIYGAPDPALTGTLTGFVPADDVTATYTRVAGETVAGSPYTISATLSPATVLGNYNITYNTAAFTISQASTTTALTATPNPADFGQSVLLKATVAPVAPGAGAPTGTVTFQDGSTRLTTVAMSNAAATFTNSSLAAGTHNLTASYSGDANFIRSSSTALAEQVLCGVLINISPSTVRLGGTITVTGQVISCATTAQTVVVKFSLSGPLQPNKCGSTKSGIFTTPPFTLPAKTSKSVSFPFPISNGACTGTYSITATTLVNGTPVNSSTASLTITAH